MHVGVEVGDVVVNDVVVNDVEGVSSDDVDSVLVALKLLVEPCEDVDSELLLVGSPKDEDPKLLLVDPSEDVLVGP